MNEIYRNGNYVITVSENGAQLSNGTKTTALEWRKAVTELNSYQLKQLKAAKANPADYVSVGLVVVRAAAAPAWDAAVDAEMARRRAETAAKQAKESAEIAAEGRRALVFHGNYLLDASLAYVRELRADELTRFVTGGLRAIGSWTHVDREAASAVFAEKKAEGAHIAPLATEEAIVIEVTASEWDALVAATEAKASAKASAKAAKAQAKDDALAAAFEKARTSNSAVEIERIMDSCDGSACECSHDLIIRRAHPDGQIRTSRVHCH